MSDLAHIRRSLDLRRFDDARDWSMLTLAFFGLLRIGEYCDSGIRVKHIRVFRWGIALTIPFSKTSTEPVTIRIAARGDDDLLCPASALCTYISFLHPTLLLLPSTPLYLKYSDSIEPYPAGTFEHRIRYFAQHVLQRDPSRYGGHSLRRGGATALYVAGVPEVSIQQHGRWKSLAVRTYMNNSSYHQLLPTVLLLHQTKSFFATDAPSADQQ